jgi:hypothetical protein
LVDVEAFIVVGVPPFVSYETVYVVQAEAVTDNVVL